MKALRQWRYKDERISDAIEGEIGDGMQKYSNLPGNDQASGDE